MRNGSGSGAAPPDSFWSGSGVPSAHRSGGYVATKVSSFTRLGTQYVSGGATVINKSYMCGRSPGQVLTVPERAHDNLRRPEGAGLEEGP